MDAHQLVQRLLGLSEEDGRAYIIEHRAEFGDPAAIGVSLREEVLRQRDIQPFAALRLAELLIFFGEYLEHLPSYAMGLHSKGIALSVVEHEQAAMDYMDAGGKMFLQIGDEVNWARTRIGWIISCAWLSRVEEALQVAAQARSIFERYDERYWICAIDHNTAVIYTQIGEYRKALELYDRMLAIYPTLTDRGEAFIQRAIALVELNQGRNLTWMGNFEQAHHLLLRAQASFQALGQTWMVMVVETNLAHLDYAQGYYGSALRRYYQLRDTVSQSLTSNPHLLASSTLQISKCLVKLNRAQEAYQLAAEAVSVRRELGVSLETGQALQEYAAALIAANRLKDAIAVLDETGALFNEGGFVHYATVTRLQQAELLLEMGLWMAAYQQAASLRMYFDAQGLISRSAAASLVMVGALIKQAQEGRAQQEQATALLMEATILCKQIADLANQHNLQEQTYKSLYLRGQLALLDGHSEEAEGYYSAAIEQIEQILDDLVLDLRPAFLHTTWVVYEDMIALCLQQGRIEHAFGYLERARSTALRQYLSTLRRPEVGSALTSTRAKNAAVLHMQEELNSWQSRYHDYSAKLAALDGPTPPEIDRQVLKSELQRSEARVSELFERLHLAQFEAAANLSGEQGRKRVVEREASPVSAIESVQLCQQLAPDHLLLAYFLYQGKLVIFAATPEGLVTHENPDGLAQLERLLPPLYAHLEPRGWVSLQNPPQLAIRRVLQKLYSMLITPVAPLLPPTSGTITIVPYGPLHSLPFHALHTGTHFLIEDFQINYLPASNLLLHLNAATNVPATKPPLVFGYSGYGELQRALDEAKILSMMLKGNCYLEEQATIARLTEESEGSPIIHLATHGLYRLDAPNFSYVRLADGQLNAIDAFCLNLDGCELVTLSGCETGLALSGGGDEQLGLGRAFLAAGASSLVMSLWPAEDSSANELMQHFYQRLLAGDGKAQALRSAQCRLLAQTSSPYTHPYFWAAFRLVGDVGSLQRSNAR